MRDWLKRVVLATQGTPLVGVYRGVYEAALRTLSGRLSRTQGVRAVYVVSGLVDEPVYGVSDIDLVVLVEDPDGYARLRVRELLGWLRDFIPMLEEPDKVGVFPVDRVGEALARSALLEYRWLVRPRRLLWGDDVLSRQRPVASRLAQARAELGEVWSLAVAAWLRGGMTAEEAALRVQRLRGRIGQAVLWAREGRVVGRDEGARAAPAAAGARLEDLLALTSWGVETVADLETAPDRTPIATLRATVAAPPDLPGEVRFDSELSDDPRTGSAGLRLHVAPRGDLLEQARAAAALPLPVWLERDGVAFALGGARGVRTATERPDLFASEGLVRGAGELAIPLTATRRAELEAALAHRRAIGRALVGGRAAYKLTPDEVARLVGGLRETEQPGPDLHLGGRDETLAPAAAAAELARLTGTPPPPAAPARLTVSVVICTRNRAPLLRAALASIAAQTRAPDQLVVLDNGSSDDTPAVIAAFAHSAPFAVDAHTLAEPSIPAARNAGARAARGDVIAFLDDDAVARPDWLERLVAALERDPRVGVVGGDLVPAPAQRGVIADFFRQYMGPA